MASDFKKLVDKFNPNKTKDVSHQAKDNVNKFTEKLKTQSDSVESKWVDKGIQEINVIDLPEPEGINDAADFSKVSAEEMGTGLKTLQEKMKPLIENGQGDSSDYWQKIDAELGLSYPNGYQRIYEAFYGASAIRVGKIDDQYDIINGRHRIWLAKRLGINTLPVRLIEQTK